jgi:hypothetical protein
MSTTASDASSYDPIEAFRVKALAMMDEKIELLQHTNAEQLHEEQEILMHDNMPAMSRVTFQSRPPVYAVCSTELQIRCIYLSIYEAEQGASLLNHMAIRAYHRQRFHVYQCPPQMHNSTIMWHMTSHRPINPARFLRVNGSKPKPMEIPKVFTSVVDVEDKTQ